MEYIKMLEEAKDIEKLNLEKDAITNILCQYLDDIRLEEYQLCNDKDSWNLIIKELEYKLECIKTAIDNVIKINRDK